jgi:succinyl-CoA synthetase beta subunit
MVSGRPALLRAVARAEPAAAALGAVRHLNLHEYQSKTLMDKHSVRCQRGREATSAEQAFEAAKWIKTGNPKAELILKAQIHAGGRGKGTFKNGLKGGVKVLAKPEEVKDFAGKMLGQTLVTHQTGPEGQVCNTLLVNEGISIDSEKYFAILMDRAYNGPVMVASKQGGMDIEAVAEKDPSAIVKEGIDIMKGVQPAQTKRLAEALGFKGEHVAEAQKQMANLYNLFMATDATQVR